MGERLENAKALSLGAIRDGNFVEAINRYAGERDNEVHVEHWDVTEEVQPADQWVNSGKS